MVVFQRAINEDYQCSKRFTTLKLRGAGTEFEKVSDEG
jgi:hypothetical protein